MNEALAEITLKSFFSMSNSLESFFLPCENKLNQWVKHGFIDLKTANEHTDKLNEIRAIRKANSERFKAALVQNERQALVCVAIDLASIVFPALLNAKLDGFVMKRHNMKLIRSKQVALELKNRHRKDRSKKQPKKYHLATYRHIK